MRNRTRRLALSFAILASTAAVSSESLAQSGTHFGDRGQLILSADRLVPVFSYDRRATDVSVGGVRTETSVSNSSISLLWGNGLNPHTVPRVAFDYTVIRGLTVGGSAVVALGVGGSTEVRRNGVSVNNDSPSTTLFGFAPRVGYILPITDAFAFWPRGGFAFYHVSQKFPTDNDRTQSETLFSLDLDPQFVVTPVPHFGFHFGPLVNLPFPAGSAKTETRQGGTTVSVSNDLWVFHFGISAGVLGYF